MKGQPKPGLLGCPAGGAASLPACLLCPAWWAQAAVSFVPAAGFAQQYSGKRQRCPSSQPCCQHEACAPAFAVGELWNKRWNLTVGNALRFLVYDPINEGAG